jgi:tetratricopeptide (TPR) repeat protein
LEVLKMSEQPKRPKQHELEDMSRRAFEAALPSGWVYRTVERDYGIDGEVEIFDQGQATGLLFKVQLRATSNPNQMTVRLRAAQANYFRSLTVPVLLVLYQEQGSAIFVRWFQSFDPQFDRETEQAVILVFDESHRWTDETASRLQHDMEVLRSLTDRLNIFPVPLFLDAPGDGSVCGVEIVVVRASLRAAVSDFGDLVRFVEDPSEAMGVLRVRPDVIGVDFRTLASRAIHFPKEWAGEADVDRVVADAMIMLGAVLGRFGFSEPAGRIYETFVWASSAPRSTDLLESIVARMMETRRYIDALRLLERAQAENPDDAEYFRLISSVEFSRARRKLSSEESSAVADYLRQRVDEATDDRTIAQACYNLANWLHSVYRSEEAIEWYGRAGELDKRYLDRDYFHAELGGALFESGRFAEAAASYRRALEIRGEDPKLRVLLADALLMAGRFREAEDAFREALGSPDVTHPEWPLKVHVLGAIRRVGGEAQSRDEEAAHDLLASLDPELDYQAQQESLVSVLQLDALCIDAWAQLGFLELERRSEGAFEPMVVAAVIARHAVELWTTSVLLAIELGEGELVNLLIRCAFHFRREEFARALVSATRALSDEGKMRAVMILEEVMQEPRGRPSFTIRQYQEDGSFEPMVIEFPE